MINYFKELRLKKEAEKQFQALCDEHDKDIELCLQNIEWYKGDYRHPDTECPDWLYHAYCKKCNKGLFSTRISPYDGSIDSAGTCFGYGENLDRYIQYTTTSPELRERFNELIYEKFPEFKEPHPERAEKLRMEREAQFAKEKAERAAYFANKEYFDSKKPQQPHCPNCKSTNVRPISQTKRVASTVAFGIASSTIGKSYECLNCKHKW